MTDKTIITRSGWDMNPADSEDALKMANWIAESGLVPNDFKGKPKMICVAAAMGAKLGLDVFSSMAGIAVINGRPSIWGDVLRGLILAHPKCIDLDEHYEGEGDGLTAVCIITREGMKPHTERFSVADAKEAGLWGKNVWAKFSKDMLLNRAFGRAARRRFADALSGLHVAEEMQDAEQIKDVPIDKVKTDPAPAKSRQRVTASEVIAAAESGTLEPIIPTDVLKDVKFKEVEAPSDQADNKATGQAIIDNVEGSDVPPFDDNDPGPQNSDNVEEVSIGHGVTLEILTQAAKELAASTNFDTIRNIVKAYTRDETKDRIPDLDQKDYQRCYNEILDVMDMV